jgi:hypothetical protein
MGVDQVQILHMVDSMCLIKNIFHSNIMGDGRKEGLCKLIHEELVYDGRFNQPSMSYPLMNMIEYVGGRGLSE